MTRSKQTRRFNKKLEMKRVIAQYNACIDIDEYDVKTPLFDSILSENGFDVETSKWIYALYGRMIFPDQDPPMHPYVVFTRPYGTPKDVYMEKYTRLLNAGMNERRDAGVVITDSRSEKTQKILNCVIPSGEVKRSMLYFDDNRWMYPQLVEYRRLRDMYAPVRLPTTQEMQVLRYDARLQYFINVQRHLQRGLETDIMPRRVLRYWG